MMNHRLAHLGLAAATVYVLAVVVGPWLARF
jgi:hypothetical protein